jgi:hypothetical protein
MAKFIKGFDSKHGCTKAERLIYYIYMPIRLGDDNPGELTTALFCLRAAAPELQAVKKFTDRYPYAQLRLGQGNSTQIGVAACRW